MVIKSRTVIVAAIVSVWLGPQAHPATEWPECVSGTFSGKIEAAGQKLTSETRFLVEDQTVNGTYSFAYKGETVEGTLSSARLEKGRSIRFQWQDKFGTGTLITSFNEDCSEFTGKWGSEGKQPTQSWTGKRQTR